MRPTLIFAALALTATTALADREVTHHFASAVPAGNVKRVVVDIPVGEITIRNGAAGSIAISGYARREYGGFRDREENQRIVDDVRAEVYVSNEEALVRRRFGPSAQGWSAYKFTTFDLTVFVPTGVAVDLETKVGEVKVDGAFGDVDIDLRAGEIELRMPRSAVRELNASCRIGEVHTDLGDEIVDREGILPGRTHFYGNGRARVNVHTTVGEVRVTLMR